MLLLNCTALVTVQIIKATGYAKSTHYRIVSRLKAGKEVECIPHDSGSDIKRTPRFLAGRKRSIKANPSKSMASLAKIRNVSKMTISKAIRVNLNMNSYVGRRRNILTARLKEIRKEKSAFLLNHLKNCGGVVRFFVDEKKFVVDEVAKRRNSRVISLNLSEVSPIMQSKNSASVMLFGGIVSDGNVTPTHFIEVGLKINTVQYIKILERFVLP